MKGSQIPSAVDGDLQLTDTVTLTDYAEDGVTVIGTKQATLDQIRKGAGLGDAATKAESDAAYDAIGAAAAVQSDVDQNETDADAAIALKADASAVSNIDNTSDVNKPISTATQTAFNIAAATTVAQLNPKAFAGGVQLDGVVSTGATSQDAGFLVPASPNYIGTSWAFVLDVFIAEDLDGQTLVSIGSVVAGSDSTTYGGMQLLYDTDGNGKFIFSTQKSGAGGAVSLDSTGGQDSNLVGRWAQVLCTYDLASTTARIFIDGGLDAESLVMTVEAMVTGGRPLRLGKRFTFQEASYLKGGIKNFALFNTSDITATHAQEIYTQGVSGWLAANPTYQWGSPLDIMAGWDFTSGWLASGATIDDLDSFTTSTPAGVIRVSSTVVGQTYKLRVAATTTSSTLQVWETETSSPQTLIGTLSDGVLEVEYVASKTRIYIRNSTAGVTDVTEISLIQVGCLANLPMDEGVGYQLHDQSTNHFDALLSETGTTHLQPKREGFIRDFNVDAYNGGGAVVELVDSSRAIVPSRCILTGASLWNNDPGFVSSVVIDSGNALGGSTPFITCNLSGTRGAACDLVVSPEKLLTYNNLNITSVDTDATDLDVRVDYKLID